MEWRLATRLSRSGIRGDSSRCSPRLCPECPPCSASNTDRCIETNLRVGFSLVRWVRQGRRPTQDPWDFAQRGPPPPIACNNPGDTNHWSTATRSRPCRKARSRWPETAPERYSPSTLRAGEMHHPIQMVFRSGRLVLQIPTPLRWATAPRPIWRKPPHLHTRLAPLENPPFPGCCSPVPAGGASSRRERTPTIDSGRSRALRGQELKIRPIPPQDFLVAPPGSPRPWVCVPRQ